MSNPLANPLIARDLEQFEERLALELRSSVEFIEAIGDDLVTAGGKRLRPSLAFYTSKLLGSDSEQAMQVALAVELLHSASLLHDDLIDDADTRRGHEAAFRRYGNVVSVMSGDYMLARVLGILARSGSSAFTQLMSDTAAQICEGEVLQFQMATLETYSFENYIKVIEGKTAVLFAAALEGVAILHDLSLAKREALRRFGMSYGRAFQMRDDYLDLMGEASQLGKPVGGDLREGKATYPILVLFDADVNEAYEIVKRHARAESDIEQMIMLIKRYGADKETRSQIAAEVDQALKSLDVFEDSLAKTHLMALAKQELKRIS